MKDLMVRLVPFLSYVTSNQKYRQYDLGNFFDALTPAAPNNLKQSEKLFGLAAFVMPIDQSFDVFIDRVNRANRLSDTPSSG